MVNHGLADQYSYQDVNMYSFNYSSRCDGVCKKVRHIVTAMGDGCVPPGLNLTCTVYSPIKTPAPINAPRGFSDSLLHMHLAQLVPQILYTNFELGKYTC